MSTATYFGARLYSHVNAGGRPADHVKIHFNMRAGPVPVQHRQQMPAEYYFGAGMPNGKYVNPGPQVLSMPNEKHRKLALQPFDGKGFYQDLRRGFLE